MKEKSIIISGALLCQLYFFSYCNSGTASNNNSIPSDSVTIAQGENSFTQKCNSCHNIYFDGIGPELAGITSEQQVAWIKNFIKDPQKIINSGDTTAQKLLKRYKTVMPSFGYLPDEEIDAIISFIHSKKKLDRKPVKVDSNY